MPLAVTYRPLKSLVPYARNSRTHPATQLAKLQGSLAEFGWTRPIAIADDVIVFGHGILQAALQMAEQGIPIPNNPDPEQGPTVDLSHLSKAQRKAYVIADNRLALDSGWDEELLRIEIADLRTDGFNIDLTGFDRPELDIMFQSTGAVDGEDDAPAVPHDPVSMNGDVWLLGRHRLCCGDSTNALDVAKALNGVTPHLMVTDPPYGVNYDPDWRNRSDRANGKPYGAGAVGLVANDDRADWTDAYILFPGDVAYVWHPPGARQVEFFHSIVAAGFDIRMQVIWAKSHFPIGRGHYHVQHEPCWYAVRKGATGHWNGDRKQSTLWQIDKPMKSETGHSTQKPVECMRRPVLNNSSVGQAIYDPFVGSGTTIVAAETTGRACHALELSPAYVDVAVRRWQTLTSNIATLEATGRTFVDVAEDRGLAASGAGENNGQ